MSTSTTLSILLIRQALVFHISQSDRHIGGRLKLLNNKPKAQIKSQTEVVSCFQKSFQWGWHHQTILFNATGAKRTSASNSGKPTITIIIAGGATATVATRTAEGGTAVTVADGNLREQFPRLQV